MFSKFCRIPVFIYKIYIIVVVPIYTYIYLINSSLLIPLLTLIVTTNMSLSQASSIMAPVKCPFCIVSSFVDSPTLLAHLRHCVIERHRDIQAPDIFTCRMCTLPLPSMMDAIQHVGNCGIRFCGYVFADPTLQVSDVPVSEVHLNEPPAPNFHFPTDNPFVPGPAEIHRRGSLTARFLLLTKYFDSYTQVGPQLIASWDFLYHRHMKRPGPKNPDLRTVSPNRGKNYSQKMHVKRRLVSLSTEFTDIDIDEICVLDRELGLDYSMVARRYLDYFIFKHFSESIKRLKEWDAQCHPPNGSGKYQAQRTIHNITDVRASARHHLLRHENPVFFHVLERTYTCVRFTLNSSNVLRTFSDWINEGRSITVLERSSTFPPVSNFLVRAIKDVIDQHSRVLYHRVPKAQIIQFGLLGAYRPKVVATSSATSSNQPTRGSHLDSDSAGSSLSSAPTTNSSSSARSYMQVHKNMVSPASSNNHFPALDNSPINMHDVKMEDLRSSFVEGSSDNDSLGIPHTNNDVATGGMGIVNTPELPFTFDEDKPSPSYSYSPLIAEAHDSQPSTCIEEVDHIVPSPTSKISSTSQVSVHGTGPTPSALSMPSVTQNISPVNTSVGNRALTLLAVKAHALKVSKSAASKKEVSPTASPTPMSIITQAVSLDVENSQCDDTSRTCLSPTTNVVLTTATSLDVDNPDLVDTSGTTATIQTITANEPLVSKASISSKPAISNLHCSSKTSIPRLDVSSRTTRDKVVLPSVDEPTVSISTTVAYVPTRATVLDNKKTTRAKRSTQLPGGECPRHHAHPRYKLDILERQDHINNYKLDKHLCSGFPFLVKPEHKASCSSSPSLMSHKLHVCHICIQLSKNDNCRFFLCGSCYGLYHTGTINNFSTPTRSKRIRRSTSKVVNK